MIVCTRSLDSIAREALGAKNVAISSVDKMVEEFQVDPSISGSTKDAFIIADVDVKNRKLKQKFLTAAATKHPSVNIIYVAKRGNADVEPVNGINAVLEKPKPEALMECVFGLIEEVSAKQDVISAADSVPTSIETFKPETLMHNSDVQTDEYGKELFVEDKDVSEEVATDIASKIGPEDVEEPEELPDAVKFDNSDYTDDTVEFVEDSELIRQLKDCNKVYDVSVVTRELTAAGLIKDIIKDNAQYVNIEDRIKALHEKILSVYADVTIHSQEERLDKIKALLYDKDRYSAAANTLIEQRVDEVINLVIDKTRDLLTSRLKEIDKAIININTRPVKNLEYARLSGVMDERANLLLELQVLNKQVRDIFTNTNDMAVGIANNIADDSTSLTESPLLNARLRLHGESVVSDKSVDTIIHIMSTADRASEEFKEAARDLSVMSKKLNKLIELDHEQISALQSVVSELRASNVEDLVVARTAIKLSLRIYVAKEDTGRTVVPYVVSKLRSRTSANVLYIDLTGTSKLEDYGETAYELDDWFQNRYEKDFCAVVGKCPESAESQQRLMAALVKASDYYRYINVVLDPTQRAMLDLMLPDALVVNYIVDTKKSTLKFFSEYIKDTAYDNVARRVIINKCDIPVTPVVKELGVIDDETANIKVDIIPSVPSLMECGLRGVRPYEVNSVVEAFREVRQTC